MTQFFVKSPKKAYIWRINQNIKKLKESLFGFNLTKLQKKIIGATLKDMLKKDLVIEWENYKFKALKTLKVKPIHILIFPLIWEELWEIRIKVFTEEQKTFINPANQTQKLNIDLGLNEQKFFLLILKAISEDLLWVN